MKKIILKITILSIIMLMMASAVQSILGNGGVKAAEKARYVYTYCKNKNQIDSSIDGLIDKNTEYAVKDYVEYQYKVSYAEAVTLYGIPKTDYYRYRNGNIIYGTTANDEQVTLKMSYVQWTKNLHSNDYTVKFLLSSAENLITPYTTRDFYSAFKKSYNVTIKLNKNSTKTMIAHSSVNQINVTWKVMPLSANTNNVSTSAKKSKIKIDVSKIINK